MAEDDKGNQDNGTEGNEEDNQAVTREQLDAVNTQLAESQKMFDDLKKAQSGSDAKVTELQNQLKLKTKEAEDASKTEKQKFAERLEEVENKWQNAEAATQKAVLDGLARKLLADKGIKAPKYLSRLIGKDPEETEANINEYIEEQLERDLEAADKYAKANGRTVQKKKTKGDLKTIEEYTDDEIDAMSDEELFKIQDRSKK